MGITPTKKMGTSVIPNIVVFVLHNLNMDEPLAFSGILLNEDDDINWLQQSKNMKL